MAKSKRTYEERLAEMERKEQVSRERAKRLAAQKKELQKRQNAEDRKVRTHRLCQIGGGVESALGRPMTLEEIPRLVSFLQGQEKRGGYFSKALQAKDPTDSVQAPWM